MLLERVLVNHTQTAPLKKIQLDAKRFNAVKMLIYLKVLTVSNMECGFGIPVILTNHAPPGMFSFGSGQLYVVTKLSASVSSLLEKTHQKASQQQRWYVMTYCNGTVHDIQYITL
jgi:hypothetical protein